LSRVGRCDHFLDKTGDSRRVLNISCTVGGFVELSRKSDHIARFILTATKTVGDSRDPVLCA